MANIFASTLNDFGLLKTFYAGPIVTQFNDEMPMYREIEKGKEKWNGQQINRPIKVLRNPGIGATSDGGNLPPIGKQSVTQATILAKYLYLRFGVTGPMLKASQGDKGSFANVYSYEMEQGMIDHKKDVNRQLFWNGDGKLATVAANVIASNVLTATGRETGEQGDQYLFQTQVIDIIDGTTGAVKAQGVTINSISGTTTVTCILSQAVTCSANDFIVHTNSYNMEVQGLLTGLDGLTTTIYGIDRSQYNVYQGNVINAQGNQLNLNLMKQAFNEMRRRGGGKLKAMYSDYDSERFYEKLLVADKRYIGKVKGDGTFASKDESYLEYAGVPLVVDPDCPKRFFFLDMSHWKKYVLAELEWADEQGSPMIAQISSDAYEVRLRHFFNLFPEKPSSSAVLRNYISP